MLGQTSPGLLYSHISPGNCQQSHCLQSRVCLSSSPLMGPGQFRDLFCQDNIMFSHLLPLGLKSLCFVLPGLPSMNCALAAPCPVGSALPNTEILSYVCHDAPIPLQWQSWPFYCFTGVPGPIQVIIPLTPTLMAEHSLPTILYLCWGLSPLHSQYLVFVLANSHASFPEHISGPGNFKFQSFLPGHLQPSRLSHYPSTNRN